MRSDLFLVVSRGEINSVLVRLMEIDGASEDRSYRLDYFSHIFSMDHGSWVSCCFRGANGKLPIVH